MKNYNKYIENFKIALQKENLKFTEQRVLVLNSLLNNNGHYECEDIIKLLSDKGSKVSRATVYRTLDILVKYGFAHKLVLDNPNAGVPL